MQKINRKWKDAVKDLEFEIYRQLFLLLHDKRIAVIKKLDIKRDNDTFTAEITLEKSLDEDAIKKQERVLLEKIQNF
ncbi:MAG: hypothetical protein J7L47_09190 [Candidatus Odinarchaeota archaeon]|nr:hypothetical protein [Candidatus Odinarchaeota archaeon]